MRQQQAWFLLFCNFLLSTNSLSVSSNGASTTLASSKLLPKVPGLVASAPKRNLEAFAEDTSTVLHHLRADPLDNSLPDLFDQLIDRDQRLTYATLWDLESWKVYRSRRRYLRGMIQWPQYRLLQRILPQFAFTMAWTGLVILGKYIRTTKFKNVGFLAKTILDINVSPTSLAIISGFVATLLTLRSNQGLDRLNEARKNVEKAVLHVKDCASLVQAYMEPHDSGLSVLCARHLSAFLWSLKAKLRASDENDVLQTLLAGPAVEGTTNTTDNTGSAGFVIQARHPPTAILIRLRQAIANCADRGFFRVPQHTALERDVYALQQVITTCERLIATPIPPIYTTHTSRLLVVYIAFLPLALLNIQLSYLATFVTTAAAAFAMLGLDEISHLLEQPFQLMPLYQSAKIATQDVADTMYYQRPPPLTIERDR